MNKLAIEAQYCKQPVYTCKTTLHFRLATLPGLAVLFGQNQPGLAPECSCLFTPLESSGLEPWCVAVFLLNQVMLAMLGSLEPFYTFTDSPCIIGKNLCE